MRPAVIDLDTYRLVSVDGKVLKGSCKRCGQCCKKCQYLYWDSFEDHEHTRPVYSCRLQELKPFYCVVGPLPEGVREGCGFYWE